MGFNLTQKLIRSRLIDGQMKAGEEIALRMDQVLLSDVLGVLVMLELEAVGLDRIQVDLAVQYIDHNLIEGDHLNADEHLFLRSACQKFGVWYSRAGNGISHPVHMHCFGRPGVALVGCDSHTPAAGSLGMLAFGAGGIEVAAVMAGEPLFLQMPQVWGVHLTGQLPEWVSAKDVILEMLRRHGTEGGLGRIIEYYGPGLDNLSAMDRHVIANMGAELGATSTVFPSDAQTRRFLREAGREQDWMPLAADPDAEFDLHEKIDLCTLEPLIALPSSPGNVVSVRSVSGREITQSYLGSSANPGFRDFAVAAYMVGGRHVHDRVSFDINPSSRQVLQTLIANGQLNELVLAGARIHQPGCNGCIGMGQAPATGRNSLRTVPRNFPGRSGTREDSVFLCSPETAAASALTGRITDPRDLGIAWRKISEPAGPSVQSLIMVKPAGGERSALVTLEKTQNIATFPDLGSFQSNMNLQVMLKLGDDVSTDDIIAAGTRVMPFWSNIPRSADFAFEGIDASYARRSRDAGSMASPHIIIAGANYGQGSSRENAAIVPRYLGLAVVIAKSFARIHWQNLINFGVLPLTFLDPGDYERIECGASLRLMDMAHALGRGSTVTAVMDEGQMEFRLCHNLSRRQIDLLVSGGVVSWLQKRVATSRITA